MKIAQLVSFAQTVPPTSQNGLEFVVSWITEELVRRGHEVTLFAPRGSVTKAKLVSLIPREIDASRYAVPPGLYENWNTSLLASESDTFDIIHTHTQGIGLFSPFINTPIVQTLHHPFIKNNWPQYAKEAGVKDHLSFVKQAYDKITYVAVSKNQEEQFSKGGLFFKHHTHIHNGIPVSQFTFNTTPDNYLLYIGYINADKGAHIAVQVARTLGIKLILAGNSYGQEAFFAEHIKPYLNKDITYVGPVDFETKNKLYGGALATLAPLCWDEPFGLTLVESQACGTPVIAFNKGASAEIVQDGKTGFVVQNEKEMAEAVKKISTIDRSACRAWTEKHFSIERMVDHYEALFATLIQK